MHCTEQNVNGSVGDDDNDDDDCQSQNILFWMSWRFSVYNINNVSAAIRKTLIRHEKYQTH